MAAAPPLEPRRAGVQTVTRGRWKFVLIASPLLGLFFDFLLFPRVLESSTASPQLIINELLASRTVQLGTYMGHAFQVSMDDVSAEKFIGVPSQIASNAYVITLFKSEGKLSQGALATAIMGRLQRVAPQENRRVRDILNSMASQPAGEVAEVVLNLSDTQFKQMPLRFLYLVLLDQGTTNEQRKTVSDGIAKVLRRATDQNISTLAVPCLGYNWTDKNSISFADCFSPLFTVASSSQSPRIVSISLYNRWPTATLEEAVSAINSLWSASSKAHWVPPLYRGELRTILVALSLSLLVSSFYIPLTIKAFLIITTAFVGLAFSSSSIINLITFGSSTDVRELLRLAVLFILALSFPLIVRWSPKDLFEASEK
jgi:hypothetical protein